MKNNDEVIEIDLWKLILACVSKWWLIAIVTLVFGIAAFVCSKVLITPTYQSTVKIYVNNSDMNIGNISISTSDLTASAKLVDLYEVILNTKDTLDVVIKEAGLNYSYGQVMGMLSTSAVNDTQVFRVTVTNTSPEEAQLIADTIGKVLPDVIADIIDSADARIVENAIVPTQKVAPSNSRNAMMGAMVGFVLVVGILVVIELLDNTIKNEDDLLDVIDIPVLTYIPDFYNDGKKRNTYNRNYYKAYMREEE